MNRIEATMKKLLSNLYDEKSMDVSAEIEVMQNIIDM